MSGALKSKEFLELVEAYRDLSIDPHTSGLKELTYCIDVALKHGRQPNFATHDQRMWFSSNQLAELWSLSPSSEMIVQGILEIARLLPPKWHVKRSPSIKGPNHIAVAMHFKAGHHSVLLGSDLEEHNNPLTGWSAVLNSTNKPPQLASLFKVAHHGSDTAEHPGIWTNLLLKGPLSVLTPFTRSRLPRDTDVARVKARSSKAFLSSRRAESEIKRRGALGKMTSAKNMKLLDGMPGVIQCRVKASDATAAWNVVLDGFAVEL